VFEHLIVFLESNETALSAVAAFVVITSVAATFMRGALKRSAGFMVALVVSRVGPNTGGSSANVDVSKPVPGFGGRPAIAVLPFDNMSDDREQDYFADGITEDLLTALQAFRTFPVIARNSTFAYKGTSPDVRKVAKDLGAGYVIEGSVRKSGKKVRITAQLIDAEGHHVWAQRYDRDLSDVFALQDEIVAHIVTAIAPEIDHAEFRTTASKPPKDLKAWDYYLRGLESMNTITAEGCRAARPLLEKAIEQDPKFALAHATLGRAFIDDVILYSGAAFPENAKESLDKALELARTAVSIDSSLPAAHAGLGLIHVVRGEAEEALRSCRRAVEMNPGEAGLRVFLVAAQVTNALYEEALEDIGLAKRLSPHDIFMWALLHTEAQALFALQRYEQAEEVARMSIKERPSNTIAHVVLIAALVAQGSDGEAEAAYRNMTDNNIPKPTEYMVKTFFAQDDEVSGKVLANLRRAGWES
jgi:adenylate cyclase